MACQRLDAVLVGVITMLNPMLCVSAEKPPTDLGPIIVTASRTPQHPDEALAAVTVLTRTDIERSQSRNLLDLLAATPGIDMASNGGRGKFGSIFIRGTNSSHAVVLIDGVRIGAVSDNRESFEFLAPEQIERIEIVRGPMSSLYGSDGIGGVIQIFTRSGDVGVQPRLSIGAGAHGAREVSGGVGGGTNGTTYSVHFSHSESDGFNACDDPAGCFVVEPDDDAYRNSSYTARLRHRVTDDFSVNLNALSAEGENEFDGFSSNESDFRQQVLGLQADWRVTEAWRTQLQLAESRDERAPRGIFGSTHFDTRRQQLLWQNDMSLPDAHLLTLGYEYLDDRLKSSTGYTEQDRDNHGVFAQLQSDLGVHAIRAAVRFDDNEQFGEHTTGSLSWGLQTAEGWEWNASVGSGFQAPSFNDLYFPGFSDPNLEPEESTSYELGVGRRHSWGRWEARGFYTEIEDLVVFDLTTFLPFNVGMAVIQGVELTADTRIYGWDVRGSATLINPEDDDSGKLLARRSEQLLQLDFDRAFGRARLGVSFRAQGRRFDDPANSVRVAGFGRVDLRGEVDLARGWKLRGRVENLLDNDYRTVAGFNTENTVVFFSLDYAPGDN